MPRKLFFEEYTFDPGSCRLLKSGLCVPLEPQVGLVLKILLVNAGTYVTRQTLMEKVWNNKAVSPAVVDNRIRAVRLAIGDDGKNQRLVRTFPNKGYMFIGDLTEADEVEKLPPLASSADKGTHGSGSGFWDHKPSVFAVFGSIVAAIALIGIFVLPQTKLQATASGTRIAMAEVADNSIAVLPFGGASSSKLDSFRALGLENVLVANLTSAPALKVISPLSSFRFGPDTRTNEVSNALGARFIVSGELRCIDGGVQLVLRVTDTISNALVYAESHEINAGTSGPTSESFNTIHHASLRILNQIGVSPHPSTGKLLPQKTLESWRLAQDILRSDRDAQLLTAIEALAEVILAEPDFIPAYRDIILSYHLAAEYAGLEMTEAARQIDHYASLASARFDENVDVLVILALQARYRANLTQSLEYLDAAAALDEENADVALLRAEVLELTGDAAQADIAYDVALSFDPISPAILSKVARSKFGLGLHEQAFSTAKKNLIWNPEDIDAQIDIAVFYRETGAYELAYEMLSKALVENGRNSRAQFELLLLLRGLGRVDVAHRFDLNPELDVLAYTFEGEEEMARLAQSYDPLGIFSGYMEYTFGNNEPLYRYLSGTGRHDSFTSRDTEISSLYLFDAVFYAHASLGISDDDAKHILRNVRRYYEGRPLATLKSLEEFMGLAGLYALDGDVEAATSVLLAATDRGFYFTGVVLEAPVFATVRNDPEFLNVAGVMAKRSKDLAASFLP